MRLSHNSFKSMDTQIKKLTHCYFHSLSFSLTPHTHTHTHRHTLVCYLCTSTYTQKLICRQTDILIISVASTANDQLARNYINYRTCHACQLASQRKRQSLLQVGKKRSERKKPIDEGVERSGGESRRKRERRGKRGRGNKVWTSKRETKTESRERERERGNNTVGEVWQNGGITVSRCNVFLFPSGDFWTCGLI